MTKLRASVPLIIGRLTYLAGIADILDNVLTPVKIHAKEFDRYLPIFVDSAAFATSLFTGVAVIILARNLIRRKRRAWAFTVVILVINITSDLIRLHYHLIQVSVALLLLAILLIFRSEFYAQSDPTTKLRPLYGFTFTFIVMFLAGVLVLLNRHKDAFIGSPSLWEVAQTVLLGFVGISGPLTFASDRMSDLVTTILLVLGFFILFVPFAMFFRRVKPVAVMSQEECELVKKLTAHDAEQDSLGYFSTRRDKSVVWSPNKKAGIAYRVQSGVMLASGDPFGEFSLWPEAIDAFLEVARKHAWTPGVMGASDRGGEVWVEKAGLLAIDIGDEAIINVATFTLEGRTMGNVRHMVNRINRKGYSASTCKWKELDDGTKIELRSLAKKWRYGAPERGFSMSMDRFGEDFDEESFITITRQEGEIKGLLYFVPWSTHSLSLDRMQRERGADSGVNELMIVNAAQYAKEQGLKYVSLNFAAFRSLFERADKISAGPITRGSRNIIRFFSNFFQVESLYRFNAKFDPEWQTRYVLYPKPRDLPAVGWAAIRAEKFIASFRSHSI
ncbi:MAG: phosphatidylglycerol lysyltransferase domain-containing protein [Actinomycetes bacterium]